MICPECGREMAMLYGCGWDYDRWVCTYRVGAIICPGEIELDSTTYPEGMS